MTGYTKAYNKSTGNTIEASDFNTEYQAIDDAFNESSGHKHDGTTNEGALVPMIYDAAGKDGIEVDGTNHELDFNINVSGVKTRQMYLADGALVPHADSDLDLGTNALRFETLYVDNIVCTTSAEVGAQSLLDAADIGVTVQGYDADTTKNDVANTFTAVQTFPNTGLHILDTNASHDLIVAPGSNLTADRTLTITTGDADRTLDVSAGSVTFGAYANTINNVADEAAFKAAVNLEIGTDVQGYDADIATVAASQVEMEAGTEAAVRSMSPLRVAQAISALALNPWTLLSTTATTSGTSKTVSGLDALNCTEYKILTIGVSHNGAGAAQESLVLTITDTGAHTLVATIRDSINTSDHADSIYFLEEHTFGAILYGQANAAGSILEKSTTVVDTIASLDFTWNSGSAFDAGTIYVYGR